MKKIVNFISICISIGTFIACAILFSTSSIYANPCGDYDYSELKEMSVSELENIYCKELSTTRIYIKLSWYRNSRQTESDKDSCISTVDKIERAYMKKVKNKITHDELMDKCQKE